MIEKITEEEFESGKVVGIPIYPNIIIKTFNRETTLSLELVCLISFKYKDRDYLTHIRSRYEGKPFNINQLQDIIKEFKNECERAKKYCVPIEDDELDPCPILFYKVMEE